MFSIQNNQLWGCALATTEHPRWNENSEHWGNNLLELNIIPSGYRDSYGYFYAINEISMIWINSQSALIVYGHTSYIAYSVFDQKYGLSVKCLRNATTLELSYNDGEVIKDAYTDGDNNTYDGVKIGEQVWITTNLKTTKYQNGNNIPHITNGLSWSGLTTGAYCWYNNDYQGQYSTYGVLYNWYAVNNGLVGGDWRIPLEIDKDNLLYYIIKEYGYMGYSVSNIARVLKSCRQVNHPLN